MIMMMGKRVFFSLKYRYMGGGCCIHVYRRGGGKSWICDGIECNKEVFFGGRE